MTTCKFITYLNLTLLGNVNLSHLKNTRRKFITNSNCKLATLQFCIKLLILADIVHNQSLNQTIGMIVISPVV